MQRIDFLARMSATVAALPLIGVANLPLIPIAGIVIPDSELAKDAATIAALAEPAEVFAHSLRTFLFAELYARASGINHDVEAVFIASILHDLGLAPHYMSERRRFQVDSAEAARALLDKHGIKGTRADLIWDAIALHDQAGIAQYKQPEVQVVNAGVITDFGANLELLKREDVTAVLHAASRTGFVPVFLSTVADYVKRKPFATGNSWVTDIGYRMVPGFHLDNFVDAVKNDPFSSYH